VGVAGGSLAREQGASTVAYGFTGSVLALIMIWSYGLGTAISIVYASQRNKETRAVYFEFQ
jgi:hypothetical protein